MHAVAFSDLQAHFRNSFRINAANRAMRDAVAAEQANYSRSSLGREKLNVHFLDTFHLSLGLHWSGHDIEHILDPVHFLRPLNREFAEVLFEAASQLCTSNSASAP